MSGQAGSGTSDSPRASKAEPAFRQLCHMLSLSRTGKVQSAVDGLVLMTLCIDPEVGDGGDPNEVAVAVATYFGVTLDLGDVRLAIENHLKGRRLQVDSTVQPTRIVLAPAIRAELAERIDGSSKLEELVKAEWLELVIPVANGAEPAGLWAALQNYLGQVFHQHGAEAVQLLDSRSDAVGDKGNLLVFLDKAIDSAGLQGIRADARNALRTFFQNPSPARLRYMSELLDGTFTFFALTVSDSTAEYLKGQIPSLRLFLDTNVVLAVLGIQDNPLQDADVELLEMIKREGYPFKLYYHERTLKEILDILDAARTSLKKRHFTPAMSRAYLDYFGTRGGGFGVERRFHELNAERETDVEVFLTRFGHVEELLRDKGIHRYNQSGAELSTEDKGSYIAEFEHYLEQRSRPGRHPRRYEALDHDITVWMYLQRHRGRTTSALRSGALLLSNDYSLHAFDRAFLMNSPHGRRVPTVVLPHHLLQILRPFNRVTEDFDKRFMEIFAAPEFRTAQSDYGETATKVLSYLSGFDGVPTETAVHILNDDLLMGRLEDVEATDSEFGELIESAVIQENQSLLKNVDDLGQSLSAAEAEAKAERERAESERLAREASEAQARRASANAAETVEQTLAELAASRENEKQAAEARRAADQKAATEAAEKARLQSELDEERRRRSSAATQAIMLRRCLALVIAVAMCAAVVWGPGMVKWDWLLHHESRIGMQALAIAAIGGLAYVGAGGKHRNVALTAVVLAAVLTLLSLL